MQRNCVSKRGLAYHDSGAGNAAVLLIHAFGLDGEMWMPQLTALRKSGVRCLVPDLKGFGESARPSSDFVFQDVVDDMSDLLSHASVDHAVAVGVSMGAATSVALTLQEPDRVRGLLIADNSLADGPERGLHAARRIRRLGLMALADVYEPLLFGQRYRRANPEAVDRWRAKLVARNYEDLARMVGPYHGRPHLGSRLSEIGVPTRIVFGASDAAIPPERRADYLGIPGAVSHEIPDSGHVVNLEAPEEFNLILFDLLEHALDLPRQITQQVRMAK